MGEGAGAGRELDEATRGRCLAVLRAGLGSEEFWPAMHAAEALSLAGHGAEVRAAIAPRLATETDDQRRCGLARELVTGRRPRRPCGSCSTSWRNPTPTATSTPARASSRSGRSATACCSGAALAGADQPGLEIMAAAALARWGNPEALGFDPQVRDREGRRDGPDRSLGPGPNRRPIRPRRAAGGREAVRRPARPGPTSSTRWRRLGDAEGRDALVRNLGHADPIGAGLRGRVRPGGPRGRGERTARPARSTTPCSTSGSARPRLFAAREAGPAVADEDVSRDVFAATARNPRYSEGSVVVLRDGRLLYATTEFEGSGSDFARARIIAVDVGRRAAGPGGHRGVLQENVGSAERHVRHPAAARRPRSGLRRPDRPVLPGEELAEPTSRCYLRVSDDEGATFGPPVRVTAEPGLPRPEQRPRHGPLLRAAGRAGRLDRGRRHGEHVRVRVLPVRRPGEDLEAEPGRGDYPKRGAMEPEVLERAGGRLLMHFRTQTRAYRGERVDRRGRDLGRAAVVGRPRARGARPRSAGSPRRATCS